MSGMNLQAPFWTWLILGGVLLTAETLLGPSGFLLCIGMAACVVGAVTFFFCGIPFIWALCLFALLSLIVICGWWVLLRKRRGRIDGTIDIALNARARQLMGYRALLTEGMKNGRGRLRVNDSSWPVEAEADYPAGTKVVVAEIRGITLKIKALE